MEPDISSQVPETKQKTLSLILAIIALVLAASTFYFWQSQLDLNNTNDDRVREFYSKLSNGQIGFTDSGEFVFPSEKTFQEVRAEYISQKRDFVEVDLSKMKLSLYKEGQVGEVYPVLSKGREGSWWETPTGKYSAIAKVQNHFSSIGGVWMPWSIQFYGNYFIHGWPYYEGGYPVESTYSGGCVRLSTEDAKKVFAFVNSGTPILLLDEEDNINFGKLATGPGLTPSPAVSAQAYLISNLASGESLLSKNQFEVLPIASVTKLMTGVVASELVYLERPIAVREDSLATALTAFSPQLGERYIAFDLLYPLLMQSSNEAAEILSGYLGQENFIANMNKKATSLFMDDTNFADSSGKLSSNTSSTKDVEKLLHYIYFKRQFLLDITKGKQDYRFSGRKLDNLENYNEFTNDEHLIGIKNGETSAAGQTLAGVWEFEGTSGKVPVAIILLGSTDRAKDASLLLDWFEKNYSVL